MLFADAKREREREREREGGVDCWSGRGPPDGLAEQADLHPPNWQQRDDVKENKERKEGDSVRI